MPRGGARPGAGRPPKHAAEQKREKAAKQLAKCKDKISASLPELIDAAIGAALDGDRNLLKFLLEQGIGKAPVMPTATPDTEIKVVLGNIPRPKRGGESEGVADEGEGPLPDADGMDDGDATAEEEAEAVG